MPVSRLDACYLHEAAERHDVQIISVDRPGIGISDFQADRTLLSTADDVQELAEKLGFGDSFSIIGHSYGCITAAACGLKVRSGGGLKKVALVAPFAPNWMTRVNSKAGRKCREFGFDRIKGPLIFRLMRQAAFSPLPTSQWILRQMAVDLLPKADRHYADSELMVQSLGQDSCQGPAGPLRELQLGICDWDFKLKDIKEGQRFTIWQGTCDTFTPPAVGRFYECGNDYDSGIEGSRYREAPGDGHYSLLGTIDDKIIRSILP
jgi:pimeloyl-ACP methyl ester carboxylesterase